MKKKSDPRREEIEQYRAYDQYAYTYQNPPQQPNHNPASAQDQYPEGATDIPEPEPVETPEQAAERVRAHSRAVTTRVILTLAILVLVIIILQSVVFRLTKVCVYGNVTKTPQQVAAESGLVKGLNMFAISEDEIRKNLSSDHTIIFKGLQKEYPNTIHLYISERIPVASLQWLGLLYTIDAEGVVINESNTTTLPQGMPSVNGLEVASIQVGQMLTARNQEQLTAYCDIMSELELQEYRSQVKEINLSDIDNLYLQIRNGISVRLGTREYMRAKIGAIRTDIPYLEQLGKTAGVLDVSTPEDAKYSPDS